VRWLVPALALPYAPGPNASGFAAVAFSAPACKLDAAGSLGQAWYGVRDRAVLPIVHAHRLPWIRLRPHQSSRPR